jgi:putative Ig domain-containing protein
MKIKYKKRSGSAILLALLVVSAILSSALYINVLSIRGMKQSQNVDNSIVAFYAAETGNEQAIYYIRKVDNFDISTLVFDPENPNSNSVLTIDSLISREVEDGTKNILISLKKDETYQLDIFDQNDLNASSNINHLDLSWSGDCASPKIELTVNEWDAGASINWEDNDQMHISKCIIDSPAEIDGSGDPCGDVILNQSMSYQFRFKALNCDVYNLNIKAFDMVDQQIAFKNIYSIESVGEYPVDTSQSNKQALHVNLRRFSPLSGLFDYVLFSEKSIVKDLNVYNEGWFGDELFISTDSLPDAIAESAYSYTVSAVNGVPNYVWDLSGSISGLTIDSSSGVISGTVGAAGTYPLLIWVEDEVGDSDSKYLFLRVNE